MPSARGGESCGSSWGLWCVSGGWIASSIADYRAEVQDIEAPIDPIVDEVRLTAWPDQRDQKGCAAQMLRDGN